MKVVIVGDGFAIPDESAIVPQPLRRARVEENSARQREELLNARDVVHSMSYVADRQ